MSYRGEKRWVAPHAGKRAPSGTGFLWDRVRNGPGSRKLPQAHSQNATFPEVVASAVPSPAGVRRTPIVPIAAAVSRASTSCPKQSPIYPQIAPLLKLDDHCKDSCFSTNRRKRFEINPVDGSQLFKYCCPRSDSF
ncbi:hypothetical protein ATANTOWER_003350 [Ataeniobius toweri]|uniref:Uncharacterized protein n=1 Tax=Ataeniobius toweri TaxID=208326 RepID=A0ABU7AP54_9TELE|nr:hypothetical protein [Ataeniobius toweri]